MFERFARQLALLALPLAVPFTLAACGDDVLGPTDPQVVETPAVTESAAREALTEPVEGLEFDGKRPRTTRPLPSPARFAVQLENVPGAGQPLWAHFDGRGNLLRSYPSFAAALAALEQAPANSRRHVGAGIDFSDARSVLPVIDAIQEHATSKLGNFEIQDLMSRYESDPGQLRRIERFWIENYHLPQMHTLAELEKLENAIRPEGSEGSLGRFLGIFTALWGALTGEDNRFDDHDGDGVINVHDDDYDGTLWRNGAVSVSGGGDNKTIEIGSCFDPCPPGMGELMGCL